MSEVPAPVVFVISLVVLSWASLRLTDVLERVGARLRFPDGLLGIVTALAADAPEISSAFAALVGDHHDVGLGVVLGSNIFNLAGLLGLSAVVAGRVSIGRKGLWFNGAVSLVVSAIVLGVILGGISPGWSLVVVLLVLAPYVGLIAIRQPELVRLRVPAPVRRFLAEAIGHVHRDARKRDSLAHARWHDAFLGLAAIALIIVAGFGCVRSVVALAESWSVSSGVMSMLVLAALTSVPNLLAAVRLAKERKGAAVVSETLNSNSLNVLAGICLPAWLFGFVRPSAEVLFAAFWLIGMKLFALGASGHRHGLHRSAGWVLIALYLAFVAIIVVWPG